MNVKCAVIQLKVSEIKNENLKKADEMIRNAAALYINIDKN